MPFLAWKPPKPWRSTGHCPEIHAIFIRYLGCGCGTSHRHPAVLKGNSVLCFLAVDPIYRRQHIARQMVDFMLTQMEDGKDITVTTYREGNPNGIAARAFYKRLGFSKGKLTEEFGSPVQEFVLKR